MRRYIDWALESPERAFFCLTLPLITLLNVIIVAIYLASK